MKPTITIGADPEVFIKNPMTGKFLSAMTKTGPVIPGTKHSPHVLACGACQIDGVAMEFNTLPSKNATQFVRSINDNLSFLSSRLREYDNSLVISISPTASFDPDYFETLPPEAKELGCEPDYNAYTGDINPKPETERPFRTASGHVHVGWTEHQDPFDTGHFSACRDVAKQLDISLYIPSLFFDKDTTRRTLYGAPGAYRPKPYGCEYRVLSNRWLKNETLIRWVFNTTLRSMNDLIKGRKYFDELEPDIVEFFTKHSDAKHIRKSLERLEESHQGIFTLPEAV